MPCYHPITAYWSHEINDSGKRSLVFNPNQGIPDNPLQIACGQCIGCKLEKSRQWAVRCLHEASLYDHNQYVTLTYNDENLPKDGNLQLEDFQKFMKRLRKKKGNNIRYFHCGEYGDQYKRPHYHALLFNVNFKDKQIIKNNQQGDPLYTSQELLNIWQKGHVLIGDVTFQSAAYVARYITKKITGKDALHHYNNIDLQTGEVLKELTPEYTTMSRRPGIAYQWYEKFKTDVFPDDFVVVNGKKVSTPKYYLNRLEKEDPEAFEDIKFRREEAGKKCAHDNTYERLLVKEKVKQRQTENLKRNYENET